MPEATSVDTLHPGVHVAIARGRMDEAQLARAMAAGEIASPQPYGNSWFFNLRITGTGSSYRAAHDEHVWRDPSIYMNRGFLDRCNGLPVVILHPSGEMLDTKEYAERNIGSIVYPYLREDVEEVWGIARILDMPAAKFMQTHQLSTSPAVVFLPSDGNQKIDMGDGEHLLIEGKPSLLDHLAVCEEGVWDKGGPPAGVDVTGATEVIMPDNVKKDADRELKGDARKDADEDKVMEDKKDAKKDDDDDGAEADARRDAEVRRDEQIDNILKGIKVIGDRMDAFEDRFEKKDRKDGEMPENFNKDAKKDEDEDEKRDDASKKDDDPETEKRQAAQLRELAEEEEKEATKGDRKDADENEEKREDRKDSARFRMDESEEVMDFDKAARKRGETDAGYARRCDALAKELGAAAFRRGDESTAAYCDRMDLAVRKDRARKDALAKFDSIETIADQVGKLGLRLEDFTKRFEDRTPEDEESFADAQARADDAYSAFGERAPRPLRGENLIGYRIRLARGLQKHSELWKESDLGSIARADAKAFENVEKTIYADATVAARNPTGVPMGQLREMKRRLPTGVEISEFAGDPLAWMGTFMAPGRAAKRLVTRPFHERQ